MDDLISRETVRETLQMYIPGFKWDTIDKIVDGIHSEPSEIVRCKDCKYWLPHKQFGYDADNGERHDYCAKLIPEDDYYAFRRNADDFCSRAERKRRRKKNG